MTLTDKTLSLPRPLVNKILAHAQKNPTIEVCGLIGIETGIGIGNSDTVKKTYYSIDNIANNPGCRFLMDASQQIKAMKQMRNKQQTLFAIVHSHPTAKAEPSTIDIKENSYKDVFYIIISLNTKGVLEMRAYITKKNGMVEVELILDDKH